MKRKPTGGEIKWSTLCIMIWILIIAINWKFGIGLAIVWHLADIKWELRLKEPPNQE